MPDLLPLRGLRYTAAAGPLASLLAPPYDVITPAGRAALAASSPHNAVHLELAEGGDERYASVAALLRAWENGGVLRREPEPAIYIYEQRFEEQGPRVRRGILVGVEAQPWAEGAVKPHEFTMSGPKEDRLRLLEATRTQLSPVFMIARDRAGRLRDLVAATIAAGGPDAEAVLPGGEEHRLWVVPAGRRELGMLAPLYAESFYIADGHHRYETAVNYRDALGAREGPLAVDHPARFALTAVVAAEDPGLVIRPIHRIIPRPAPARWREALDGAFDCAPLGAASTGGMLAALMAEGPGTIIAFGLPGAAAWTLRLRDPGALAPRLPQGRSPAWAAIAPNVLRYGVLEPLWGITDDDLRAGAVEYTHDPAEVAEALAATPGACAFLINHVGIAEVMALADQGERMPQKSTFFHPKLGTGLVFHPLYK